MSHLETVEKPDALIGLRDALMRGWFDNETASLYTGFPIGPGDVVADIGCGLGGHAEFCASHGAEVILVDADPARLAAASARIEARTGKPPLEQHISVSNPLPLRDGLATRIVCTEVIEHVDDPQVMMAELLRIGAPGALYLLTVPDPEAEKLQGRVADSSYFAKPNHVRILGHAEFAALVERAGLIIERRDSFGFFWSIWLTLFWATDCKVDEAAAAGFSGVRHPVLDHWVRTWQALLDQPGGPKIKQALDDLLPKSQLIIARKPLSEPATLPEPAAPAPIVRPPAPQRLKLAAEDLGSACRQWWMWGRLGIQDIRIRYRGSALGPFWITLSLALTVGALGLLFSTLNHIPMANFLPFLCLGYLGWIYISTVLNESCSVFIANAPVIKQTKIPYCAYVLQTVWRNILIFFHNILVFVVIAAALGLWPAELILLSLAGMALVSVNLAWIGLLLGLLSARFRDVPLIVSSMLQLIFFITPILWHPEQIGEGGQFYFMFNPFYLFLTVFREPLLGVIPALAIWGELAAMAVIGWGVTFLLFARYRGRIAYWI